MKKVGLLSLCSFLFLLSSTLVFAQKKYDKTLKKVNDAYNAGNFSKASKTLQKFKASVTSKLGQQNNYMPGYYTRDARINLALGVPAGFDASLDNALKSSMAIYGENSTSYATTFIDVAEIYNEYGNFRLSREYLQNGKDLLEKSNQMNDALKARIALVEGEGMTGQGFCNNAIELLRSQ